MGWLAFGGNINIKENIVEVEITTASKSKIFIAEKNFILSNNREKIIPRVVSIATKEQAKSNPVKIFSTSCLALLFFEILFIP